MKRILSILLVLLNLSLPRFFTCFAGGEKDEKAVINTTTVVEEKADSSKNEEDKKDEKSEKAENVVKNVENTEKTKKESISLEISAETIDKIRQVLNSEVPKKRTKTQLAIETIFSILLGVGLFCSVKNQCFGSAEPIVTGPIVTGPTVAEPIKDNVQADGWFQWGFGLAKNAVLKVSDKVLNVFPFYLLLKYF